MYAETMKPTIARPKGITMADSQMRSFSLTSGHDTSDYLVGEGVSETFAMIPCPGCHSLC